MESRHLVVMMTDIQGFTRATSGMGREEVEALLALHEELLVPVIREYGGTIVKGLGDAFLVTFESPTKGVRAGARIQEVLYEHNSKVDPDRRLLVRVALNAGEVNIRDDDVFGEAVNITARVEGVCMAEQVTLTEAVFLLVDREAVETEYLEDVELKGIPFPVKLYRVSPRWLPEADRDLERARSKPATPAPSPAGGSPRGFAWGLGLVALLGAGLWLAQPTPAATLVERAVEEARFEAAWTHLSQGVQANPTPALTQAGVALLKAQRAKLEAAGDWVGAYDLSARFSALLPGVAGVSEPEQLRALGLQGVRNLRASQRFDASRTLLDKLLAKDSLEDVEELSAWAEEDLRRIWNEHFPPGQPAPPAMEQVIGAEAITAALRRLWRLDRGDPWAVYVQTLRDTLAGGSAQSSLQRLSSAMARAPELGERREAEPAYRALLGSYLDQDRDATLWALAESLFSRKIGNWIAPRLEAWANEPPKSFSDPQILLRNQNLRRNSLRLARRRGLKPHPLPQVHWRADIALLGLGPKEWNFNRTLEEAQTLALRVSSLAPSDRVPLDPDLRRVVSAALDEAGAGISHREGFVQVAQTLGYDDLVDPGEQLTLDLTQLLDRQLGGHRYQPHGYVVEAVKARLGALEALAEPWRTPARQLFEAAIPRATEVHPELVPVLEQGRQHLK